MTKTARNASVGAAAVVAVLGWTSGAVAMESGDAVAGQPSLMAPDARVRGVSPRMVAVINAAAGRSKTFHALIDQIGSTDGIVYVAEGQCGARRTGMPSPRDDADGPQPRALDPRGSAEGELRSYGIDRP